MPTFPTSATIQRTVLDNGVTVLIYPNPSSQTVVVRGSLRAGALAESREQAGLAAFTADMLMRGTATRSFEAIYDDLEGVGARLSFDSGRLLTGFSSSALAEDLDLILSLTADALTAPKFPAAQVEKVRGEIIASLHLRANDTRRSAGLAFNELLYAGHPYGQSVSGYLDTVAGLTGDDLAGFHARQYGPQGMVLTIVGGVEPDVALRRVADHFGSWQPGGVQPMPPVPPASRPESVVTTHVEMADKTQTDIVLGLPGPLRSAPDYLEARLANTILGVFGMSGRVGKNVRERQGLAYYAYSSLRAGLGPSPWTVSTGVAPDKVDQAIASIRDEIRRIQDEPVPADELEDSQAYLTGSLPLTLETNGGLATIIADIELYNLGLDYLTGYADRMWAMTAADVQAAAQKYFSADEIAIATAGP